MVCEWYVVFHRRYWTRWFFRGLKKGFQHVELARPIRIGPEIGDVVWLHMLPAFEMLDAELAFDSRPPWVRCPESTVQKVTAMRPKGKVRSWFHIGPITCVEAVKWALGIRSFWLRTPWQLYRYIQRRGGVVISE